MDNPYKHVIVSATLSLILTLAFMAIKFYESSQAVKSGTHPVGRVEAAETTQVESLKERITELERRVQAIEAKLSVCE